MADAGYRILIRGGHAARAPPYSAGIGVAGAVGAFAAGVAGPLSTRSSIAIMNAMLKARTSAQARNTKRNA